MITVTEQAKDYLYKIAIKNNKEIISFGVDGGGCAGFSYKWSYLDSYDNTHIVLPIQDNVVLAIDKVAEMYIMGSQIDYVSELSGSFLKIDNPLTKSSCGCGESFSVV
tara:strand:- start:1022 stop:1345 length:324 start_codon:yes stop_codon:yes gene_type:complete